MTEAFILLRIAIEAVFLFLAFRLGKFWLFLSVALNLILVSALGSKVVNMFGFVTNAGNVFYASVFVAVQMLVERYGRLEGRRAIWVGLTANVFFMIMTWLTSQLSGPVTPAGGAIDTLYSLVPRLAVASLAAFVISQNLNIAIYDHFHRKTGQAKLWLRSGAATFVGQLVDSVIFFSVAFLGILPNDVLMEAMVTGFLYKLVLGALGMLFLYRTRIRIQELI